MANQIPLVISAGEVQRLQSGDVLIDQDSNTYVIAAAGFGTDDVLIASDGTGTGVKATAIDKDNVVTAASAFTSGNLVQAAGNDKTLVDSGIPASTVVVDADITEMVTAGSTFGTDNAVLRADGDSRIAQASVVEIDDVGRIIAILTAGTSNHAIGSATTLSAITSGQNNVAFGPGALTALQSGNANMGIGLASLETVATGSQNVAVGQSSLGATTASNNTGIGHNSLSSIVGGSGNVGIGPNTGRGVNGSNNTFVGVSAADTTTSSDQATSANNMIVIGNSAYATAGNQCVLGARGLITKTIARGTVEVESGTSATRINIYNTTADDPPTDDYERLSIQWDTNVARIGTEAGSGGGTLRDLAFDYGTEERVRLASGATIINDDGADLDFRVESNNDTNMLLVDAGNDRVLIGGNGLVFPSFADAGRPAAGVAGRVIFNTDDGNLNIDDGANWILPDGTTT